MFSMTEKPSLMIELDASNSRGQAFIIDKVAWFSTALIDEW